MLDFSFSVGKKEIHKVEFYFNQFMGKTNVRVDEKLIIEDTRTITNHLAKVYEFNLGKDEIHIVKIELSQKPFFAGMRDRLVKVFVDGDLIEEYTGRGTFYEMFKLKK
ncbi:MAG: hypothetical protein WC677_00950 [Clostridia bacterium]|jgi:hypothetical protein